MIFQKKQKTDTRCYCYQKIVNPIGDIDNGRLQNHNFSIR